MAKSSAKPTAKILSKSKLMEGIQCEKRLYFSIYKPELAVAVSAPQQAIFDQGNQVGEEARKQFPDGVMIEANHMQRDLALEQTRAALESDALVIFEAAFLFDGFFARVDVLKRSKKSSSAWEMIEVKSGTTAEEKYIQDAGVQRLIVEGSGLKLKSVSLMLINNQCVYPDLSDLFYQVDVSDKTSAMQSSLRKNMKSLQSMIAKKLEPSLDIGGHCDVPYECPYKDQCYAGKNIPQISVFNIPALRTNKKWEMYSAGKVDLSKVGSLKLNDLQQRMVDVSLSGKRFVDRVGLAREMKKWKYPLYYLDFEGAGFAIPRYEGTRPYQQLPFQFSCHIENRAGAKLEHVEFLHIEDSDPREACALALCESIGDEGSIVAYWKSYEARVLKELAAEFPKYRKKLQSMHERLVDPQPVIKNGVYDVDFGGSFSIKDVAPALIGDASSYEGMAVDGGELAQVVYKEMISADCSLGRREEIRVALLEYCKKDTMNMVELVKWMRAQ